MATNFFWIGYHFEEFRSQVAIKKKKLISRPEWHILKEWWQKKQNKKKWFSATISKNCVLYIQDPKQDLVAHACFHLCNLSLQ